MIIREKYINQLIQLKDLNIIKVVTGIRRSGKSTILAQFRDYLLNSGIHESQILYYNLEDKELEHFIMNKDALHDDILSRASSGQKYYIFIDEVQNIPEFEKTLDSLFIRNNLDIYITGSNAYITSSELGTLLSGRYVEIKMQPLSFSEFIKFFPRTANPKDLFELFLKYGGFPEVANFLAAGAKDQVHLYLQTIYETILEKDIKQHFMIDDLTDFRRVVNFMFDNISRPTSYNKISTASGDSTLNIDSIPRKRVKSYVEALTDCYVFYPVERFDIRGKQLLKTGEKYYSVDVGLAESVLGRPSNADYGRKLENIVYLELKKRYSSVYIGKNYSKEIDFVVKDSDGVVAYYQVSWTATEQSTLERELSAFTRTGDNYRRILLTMDDFPSNENGIERINVIDWLLQN